ncbi:MAG TPA: hypothetical protein VIM75_17195 [Ohtaekwangia sp.]|uniref:hypothetical protein n=1 Tax=Ohtaekwangia sp. TaxID=2066019 RepID=UPI002F9270A8
MPTLLIICFNDLKNDARVKRQIEFVKNEYTVTVACFDAHQDSKYILYVLRKTRLTFFRKALSSIFLLLGINSIAYRILYNYQRHISSLKQRNFDIILANDIETLPLAFQIAGNRSKIFFDAHEYAPRHFEDRLYWRIFFKRFNMDLCRKYIPRVHGMCTINNSLAKAYEDNFGVKPVVITNASAYFDLKPEMRVEYPIRLVHHGIFTVSRQPEIMIDMMKLLDERFTLDLIYLLPENSSPRTKQYFEAFKSKTHASGNIRVLPALKSSEIVEAIHKRYDMGIILVPPVNFNYENGLPNKLFDCIQARLAMAVGPLKEIANVTNHYKIGVVSKEFTAQSLADSLRPLTLEMLNNFKKNTDVAACEMNADFNKKILLEALQKLI